MPTTGVAQWTCAVSNLGFIYIYGYLSNNDPKRHLVGTLMSHLCWFQTKLAACRLAALPRDHRLLFQSCSSQRQRRFGFISFYHRAASLTSWIEFNCLRSAAVGKAARLSIYWLDAAWRCLPLGHPSAASGACAVVQISSSKRQCGKRQVSLKPALRSL